ncbi:cell division cycle 7-related protein kinase [Amyelois transitella]|uniref:cell division cycle 7-related protein kinase n=1 Tax=Amyelois transitella TaxID=680683 RepID=UPI00298F66DA|nr:cell division cycle 7-related protein kinase [Amyelois transitella]
MSRIRGIEAKVQKEVLLTRAHESNIVTINKNTNEDQTPKSKEEVEKQQIQELLHKLPKLDKIFEVHRKIGEGTFSSVYLGSLRQHTVLPAANKRWFAIKHLVPTAHPARIEHELRCLQDIGGKDNVIGVDLCLRHLDTIVFIMPYIPHRKFSEYVGDMDAEELRRYMRALMVALRRVHSFGVIHRDVKPSNFLYDRENQRYLLVDFGLAQRLCPAPEEPPPALTNGTRKRARQQDDSPINAKRVALDLSMRPKPANVASPTPVPNPLPKSPAVVKAGPPSCACAGEAGVCGACAARPAARAPRAGTQGFRPPEVLLKCPQQGTAVDMWASGVVLASVLTARYPFFRASDDVSALAELAELLGTAALQRAALALGRRLLVSSPRAGLCLRKLSARLRGGRLQQQQQQQQQQLGEQHAHRHGPASSSTAQCLRCALPQPDCLCGDDDKKHVIVPSRETAGFPDAAFALAWRLLEPDPRRRLSAADALRHPFLAAQDR